MQVRVNSCYPRAVQLHLRSRHGEKLREVSLVCFELDAKTSTLRQTLDWERFLHLPVPITRHPQAQLHLRLFALRSHNCIKPATPDRDMAITIDVQITPFDGSKSNYKAWIINIRAFLRRHGLWYCIEELEREGDYERWDRDVIAAADLITPLITDEFKKKLDYEDFENGYYLLRSIRNLTWPDTADYYGGKRGDFLCCEDRGR